MSGMLERQTAITASYEGVAPHFAGPPAFAGHAAAVLGRARIGIGAWLGARSVIRADGHDVVIGDDFHLGDGATVHIAHDLYSTHVGNNVAVGRGAVVHACTLEDDCVIEHGAIILDASRIGKGAVISAGSVVFPRSQLEGGWLYSGSPARKVAFITESERQSYHRQTRNEPFHQPPVVVVGGSVALNCFVAPSARVAGQVVVAEGVGIWYGCRVDAGTHRISIGAGSNVQDNSVLICEAGDLVIESDVTIGHNVTLVDCHIAKGSLVGIGSRIAAGTKVESDVLVAAGTETEPGQRLSSGHVWAGWPARPISILDDRKRSMMAATLPMYQIYAERFRNADYKELS